MWLLILKGRAIISSLKIKCYVFKEKETKKLKSSQVKMPSSFSFREQSTHGSGDGIAHPALSHRTPLYTQCPFTCPVWFYSSFDSLERTHSRWQSWGDIVVPNCTGRTQQAREDYAMLPKETAKFP